MPFSITVNRDEFEKNLRILKKVFKKNRDAMAVISGIDAGIRIDIPGASIQITAAGKWDGSVYAPSVHLLNFATSLPREDPLPISAEGTRLKIGSASMGNCRIDQTPSSMISLPLDATLSRMLHVNGVHSRKEIRQSGLEDAMKQAQEKARRLIARALPILAPFEITQEDLKTLAEECMMRKYGPTGMVHNLWGGQGDV